jgi:osmoprotectant transport system substrate-binding protein
MLTTVLTGCGKKEDATVTVADPLVIGSKDFTESIIVAEVYALALEDAGIPVERKLQLGSSVIHDAIINDEIDFYPEYTGTGLITRLALDPIYDPEECYEAVKEGYADKFDITWLAHSDVNDSEGLAMLASTADEYGINTFSDLWEKAPELVFGGNGEFYAQAGIFDRLQEVYGPESFKDKITMDHTLSFEATRSGDVDAISVYTTEGSLAGGDFIILEDDKDCWPPYYLAPIIRNDALEANPEITEIIDKVTATFTDENVIAMNAKVDVDGEEYSDVAQEYYDSIKDSLK